MLASAACSPSNVDIDAETAAVKERSRAVVAAEAAKDIETTMTFWLENGVVTLETGVQVKGKDDIRELLLGLFAAFKTFEATTTHVKVAPSGDVAYEYGTNRIVYPGNPDDIVETGKYVIIWRKVDDVWMMAAISLEDDKPSATPI